MLEFLDRLREKPESVRFKIVLITAAFITGIIFIVWLSVVSLRFSDNNNVGNGNIGAHEKGLFSSFGTSIKEFYEVKKKGIGSFVDGLGTVHYDGRN
ncbi:MAG TPA: hypothetical protein VJH21_02150 [Candidatus Paceibacterota bacterium]